MDWKDWVYHLVESAIQGAANAVVVMVVDPANFNIHEIRNVLIVMGVSAVFALANKLRQSPLPPHTHGD